ncbi:sperm flagellar protein 2-like [Chlamydotis macqueenii]
MASRSKELQNLASAFTVKSDLTDWRRFLLAAAQPWPVPSLTQLLKTLHSFKSVDVTGSGFVTQEDYMQVGLWFNGNEDVSITESCTEPLPLDRLGHLRKFFFSLFADTRKDPALLNYTEMLLYFASHSDPVEGVYRALSIATGTYIHPKKEASLPCGIFPYTNVVPNKKTLIEEDEKEVLNYMDKGIISVATLRKVLHTGGSKDEDNNRYSNLEKEDGYDKHFAKIYKGLGTEKLTPIPVALLLKHPFIQDLISTCEEYKLPAEMIQCGFTEHSGCEHKHLEADGSCSSYTLAAPRLFALKSETRGENLANFSPETMLLIQESVQRVRPPSAGHLVPPLQAPRPAFPPFPVH